MSGTTFIDRTTVITADYMNNINTVIYDAIGNGVVPPTTPAEVKTNLLLNNVTNTSDVNKPVSTAQQTALNLKANLASPTFTGTPTAPTATGGTNTTQIATTAFVTTAVATGANSPAFRATASATQTLAVSVWAKVAFDTETFDTNTNFDIATYKFTPTVSGYYQVNYSCVDTESNASYGLLITIYKNGSSTGVYDVTIGDTTSETGSSISDLVYMNGTTDYLEAYVKPLGSSGFLIIQGGAFSAVKIRS